MKLEINKSYHGFKLIKEEDVKSIKSLALVFEHTQTGAKLFKLANEDDNKVFSITFRTPPKDDTGLPHILEHSVLCGSRKFNTKEPFVELLKGSLSTFLNAMTYPDKTMYPVASKNEQDFFNLMNVYLDATLYPNIHKNELILMQEGWHYELDRKEDPLSIKGVVYNEMKGAFSSPVRLLYSRMQQYLYPDTAYAFESGGEPEFIPNLTEEMFTEFHRQYYHPANSYLFLYGDGDILKELDFLNNEYLKDFSKIEVDSQIQFQKAFDKPKQETIEYPISENEDTDEKTFLSFSTTAGKVTDPELYHGFEMLNYMLNESQAAPLKKALIDKKIGKDVIGIIDNSILQPMFGIIVKNSNPDKQAAFEQVIFETLKDLVKKGIDKELIEATINRHEFRLREAEFGYPRGLAYHIISMDSWLYDADPTLHLDFEPRIENIRSKANSGFFEGLIEKYILSNNHRYSITAIPKPGLTTVKEEEFSKQLAKIKAEMSAADIDEIVNTTKRLKERQQSVDSTEALASIPLLDIKDIEKKAEVLVLEEKDLDQVKVLYHPDATNQISYLNFNFDTTGISQEDIPYINLLASILGKIDTEKKSYAQLSNQINIHTGGIYFYADVFSEKDNDSNYFPYLVVNSKVLTKKISDLSLLLSEILTECKFEDSKRIGEIISEIKSRLEIRLLNEGHVYARKRAYSYFSQIGNYTEVLAGFSYYQFINKLASDFKENSAGVLTRLKEIYHGIFNKQNLLINLTNDKDDYNKVQDSMAKMLGVFPDSPVAKNQYHFDLSQANEGLQTSSQVQYVVKAGSFQKYDHSYHGSLKVLRTIARLDYLWNQVRVLGGAYGAFINLERNGNFFLGSYRDPNLGETLSIFDHLPDYLKNFQSDDREMRKYIIGTISDLDRHLNPNQKGCKAARHHIIGLTQDEIQKEREEVLNCQPDHIKQFADIFAQTLKENYVCVFGNEAKIESAKNLFNSIVKVFE